MKNSRLANRWWGRNAGLRPRLVLIVGIAMLAPGVLAVLQAVSGYNSSVRYLQENLAQAAQLAANEEENMISASREILTSLAAHPDVRAAQGVACRRALQRAIGGLDQYAGATVVNAEGVMTCSSGPMRSVLSVADQPWFRDVMSGDAFVVSDLVVSPWLEEWGMVTAVPLVDEQGVIAGSVSLIIGLDWVTRRYQSATSTDNTALALLDSNGDPITSRAEHAPLLKGLPPEDLIDEHLRARTQTFSARGRDDTWRIYAISPLLEGRIFVILGRPMLASMGPLALQVAWGVLTPLLMWGLAIAVVWFGIEHFVVRWITYLNRITSAYASGRHKVRASRAVDAPAEIRNLGETFDRMADDIQHNEAQLRESLAQKEVLVREIHHRVKNNLQLVMSLLNLHARRIRDPRAEAAFAEARSRINALATLHRRLYESENLQEVDLRWFLSDLCAELRRGARPGAKDVDLHVEAPAEVIGPDIAVPLGLLVTETITNAYKHAFTDAESGKISVRITRESDDELALRVTDNGSGFDTDDASEGASGLGRSLIDAFVRQLHGEMTLESSEAGTEVFVRFKAPRHTIGTPAAASA